MLLGALEDHVMVVVEDHQLALRDKAVVLPGGRERHVRVALAVDDRHGPAVSLQDGSE